MSGSSPPRPRSTRRVATSAGGEGHALSRRRHHHFAEARRQGEAGDGRAPRRHSAVCVDGADLA